MDQVSGGKEGRSSYLHRDFVRENKIATHGPGRRRKRTCLVFGEMMDDKQKLVKVQNLLQSLRKDGVIVLDSDNLRTGNWILAKSNFGEKGN